MFQYRRDKAAWFLIRAGIAFAFFYAAFAAYQNPANWISYFPAFIRNGFPEQTLMICWEILQIIIGLWILSGKKVFLPSLFASFALAGLIFYNLAQMDVIFRDVTILAAAIALTLHSR